MNNFDKGILLIIFIMGYLILYGKLGSIATDIKVIRATVTHQAKDCHNVDTMEVKNK
jgi:hypothetical protein